MPSPHAPALPDDLFLIEVEDATRRVTTRTLDVSRSPAMLLSFAANHFTEAASRYFKSQYDLGAIDWRLLFFFARNPGGTAALAARTIGIDKGAVSRSLQRLVEADLVVAGDLHSNGRSRGWTLSKQGHKLHGRMLRVALDRQKQVLRGFTPAEIESFCDFLQRFLANLAAMNADSET